MRIGLLGREMDGLGRSYGLGRRPRARIEYDIGTNQAYIVPLEGGISTMILPHILDSISRPNYLSWTFLPLRRPHYAFRT